MQIPSSSLFENLTGQKFGRYTVLEYAGAKWPNGRCKCYQWLCRCDCGKEKIVRGSNLKSKQVTSCGCYHKEVLHKRLIDLTGKKFGKLTVLSCQCKKHNQTYWKCKCECGGESVAAYASLTTGRSKSCGCRQGNFTHGLSGKPGYKKFLLADPARRLRHYVGSFVAGTLKKRNSSKGKKSVWNFLPYTPEELKNHLESLWEPWMNWDNYGGMWHVDHIKPQCKFIFTTMADPSFLECWDLSNLQPLEKIANLKKGCK